MSSWDRKLPLSPDDPLTVVQTLVLGSHQPYGRGLRLPTGRILMSHVVMAANPAPGHVGPLATIAAALVRAGHEVDFAAAGAFEATVRASGARFWQLGPAADPDGDPSEPYPGRNQISDPLELLSSDLAHGHADALPGYQETLQRLVTRESIAVYDGYFVGFWPQMLGAPGTRPARTIGVGLVPLMLASDDTTAVGPLPGSSPEQVRMANRAANDGLRQALRPGQRALEGALRALGARGEILPYFDCAVALPDVFAQLTVPRFEFPRSDAPAGLRYVGPLPAPRTDDTPLPDWWHELDEDRPVVVVTQGTLTNTDLTQLVQPTLDALADSDVLVVACLGRDATSIHAVPANARVVDSVPFGDLLPRADAYVTNGGYGGTQQALAAGVPVVVAGTVDDKAAVAARVRACGAGVDLATDRPTPQQIASAVSEVLTDPSYRTAATAMAREFADSDALRSLVGLVAESTTRSV